MPVQSPDREMARKIPESLHDVLQTMHALDTLDAATSLTVIIRRSQLARLLDHRIQRESSQNAEATPAIRQHKYIQERLDMLTGVVTEPDRQSQQGRYKG